MTELTPALERIAWRYVEQIQAGTKTIDDAPSMLKVRVEELLINAA